jgi:hypothetical protein
METLLTLALCILAVLIEFAVAALIVAPKAVVRWFGRLVRRPWSALLGTRGRAGHRVHRGDEEATRLGA